MTRSLLIECGAAETRAALFDGDEVTHLWFGPARGDERLPRPPQSGDIFSGRVKSVSKSINGAFVDIGGARDGFLPLKKDETPPVEGAAVIVKVRRPPIGGKGPVLTLDWTIRLQEAPKMAIAAQASGSPGEIGERADAALQAFLQWRSDKSAILDIIVSDHAAKFALEAHKIAARIDSDLAASPQVDEAVSQSLMGTVKFSQGASLHIHETDAGALFDVDMSAAAVGAAGRMNDKINSAAALLAMNEISRRAIGGRIIIDFLPPSGAGARASLANIIAERLKRVPRARPGRIAPDGLCDLTLPRERLSLLDFATEPAGTGWPVDGRRFTLDWAAKSAIRTLEMGLRAQPSARLRLLVARDIAAYLADDRPQWEERLAQKYGARFSIEIGASLESRRHEIV